MKSKKYTYPEHMKIRNYLKPTKEEVNRDENEADDMINFFVRVPTEEYIKLAVALKMEDMTVTVFYKYMLRRYLEKDPRMMEMIKEHQIIKKTRIELQRRKRELDKEKELVYDFNFNQEEMAEFYDFIETNDEE